MRVVTWNVNALRVRLPRVLELLGELAPGVVCLQETTSAPDVFPLDELDELAAGGLSMRRTGAPSTARSSRASSRSSMRRSPGRAS